MSYHVILCYINVGAFASDIHHIVSSILGNIMTIISIIVIIAIIIIIMIIQY